MDVLACFLLFLGCLGLSLQIVTLVTPYWDSLKPNMNISYLFEICVSENLNLSGERNIKIDYWCNAHHLLHASIYLHVSGFLLLLVLLHLNKPERAKESHTDPHKAYTSMERGLLSEKATRESLSFETTCRPVTVVRILCGLIYLLSGLLNLTIAMLTGYSHTEVFRGFVGLTTSLAVIGLLIMSLVSCFTWKRRNLISKEKDRLLSNRMPRFVAHKSLLGYSLFSRYIQRR